MQSGAPQHEIDQNPWNVIFLKQPHPNIPKHNTPNSQAEHIQWFLGLISRTNLDTIKEIEIQSFRSRENAELAIYLHQIRTATGKFLYEQKNKPVKGVSIDTDLNLSNLIIPDYIYFENCLFNKNVIIQSSGIGNKIPFKDCTFNEAIEFNSTRFASDATIVNTNFHKKLNLRAIESKSPNFKSCSFQSVTTDDRASAKVEFKNCTFKDEIDCTGTEKKNQTHFIESRFEKFPPDFNGSEQIFEGTIWPSFELWPPAPRDKDDARKSKSYYEKLKKDAEVHKRHDYELFFFKKQMECEIVIDGHLKSLPTRAYGWFSDFGTSLLKPLFGLVFTLLSGLAYFTLTFGLNQACVPCTKAGGISFANTFWPLGLRKDLFEADIKCMDGWDQAVSLLQGGFGLLFLFLIGLALRNKFRLK